MVSELSSLLLPFVKIYIRSANSRAPGKQEVCDGNPFYRVGAKSNGEVVIQLSRSIPRIAIRPSSAQSVGMFGGSASGRK